MFRMESDTIEVVSPVRTNPSRRKLLLSSATIINTLLFPGSLELSNSINVVEISCSLLALGGIYI